jgi:thiamine kinase-like enzyme
LTTKISLTPRFYGSSAKYRFVLIEDLGKHISLVDSLRAMDANAAKLALKRFMGSLGQLHAISYGNTCDYLEILKTLNPNAESWQVDAQMTLDDIIPKIELILNRLKISDTANIRLEINNIILELLKPGPFTTLIHGDICPDNVFDDPKRNELRFIDFEWAFVRNALLDGTYLRMSMPTCWFAYTISNRFFRMHLQRKTHKENPGS